VAGRPGTAGAGGLAGERAVDERLRETLGGAEPAAAVWRERLGEWTGTGRPAEAASELRLVPVITGVEAAPVRAPATLRLPGGVVLEFEPAQVSAAWVAEVVAAAARVR
jgi:hypothetical protein